jgi:hypothetical protein
MSENPTLAIEGDPFRRNYGVLTDQQKEAVQAIKASYEIVWQHIQLMWGDDASQLGDGAIRDLCEAESRLMESCMWAVRAITRTEGQE